RETKTVASASPHANTRHKSNDCKKFRWSEDTASDWLPPSAVPVDTVNSRLWKTGRYDPLGTVSVSRSFCPSSEKYSASLRRSSRASTRTILSSAGLYSGERRKTSHPIRCSFKSSTAFSRVRQQI